MAEKPKTIEIDEVPFELVSHNALSGLWVKDIGDPQKNNLLRPYFSDDKIRTIADKFPKIDKLEINKILKDEIKDEGFSTSGKRLDFVFKVFRAVHTGVPFSLGDDPKEYRLVDRGISTLSRKKGDDRESVAKEMGVSGRQTTALNKLLNKVSFAQKGRGFKKAKDVKLERDYLDYPSFKAFRDHELIQEWKKTLTNKAGDPLSDVNDKIRNLWLISLFQKDMTMDELKNATRKDKERRLASKVGLDPYELAFMEPTYPHALKPNYDAKQRKIISEQRAESAFKKYIEPENTDEEPILHPITKIRRKSKGKGKVSTTWYRYGKAYRNFLSSSPVQAVSFVKGEKGYFAQSTSEFAGNYADLKLTPAEMKQLDKCFLERSLKPISQMKGQKEPQINSGKMGLYLMFRIILECGFRANEIFTIANEEPEATSGAYAQSGVEYEDDVYHLTAWTRKTKWVNIPTHTASVLSKEVNELIGERQKQISDGIKIGKTDPERALKEFGIDMHFDRHTLIGWDNEYMRVASIDYVGDKKPTLVQDNKKRLHDAMKECYESIRTKYGVNMQNEKGLKGKKYWNREPVHFLRHVFAHKWLEITKYNYGIVAKWGHWGTVSELAHSYGKMPKKILNGLMAEFLKAKNKKDDADDYIDSEEKISRATEKDDTDNSQEEVEELVTIQQKASG